MHVQCIFGGESDAEGATGPEFHLGWHGPLTSLLSRHWLASATGLTPGTPWISYTAWFDIPAAGWDRKV